MGLLYEKLGRMAGRSYEETVQVLLRGLKNAESQTRAESMTTLGKVPFHDMIPYQLKHINLSFENFAALCRHGFSRSQPTP